MTMRLPHCLLSCSVLLTSLGSPSAWSQDTQAASARSTLQLQFNNTEVATVAQRLAWLTDAKVTLDPGLSGTINLQTQQPVSPNEAWDLFAQALSAKGMSLHQVSPGVYGVVGPKPAVAVATAAAPLPVAQALPLEKPERPTPKAAAAAKVKTPSKPEKAHDPAMNTMEIFVELAPINRPPIQNSTAPKTDVLEPLNETRSTWSILNQDKSLYHVISRWSQTANWQLIWDADRDFPIQAQISIDGTFTSAIQMVMDSLNNTDYPLQAVMNPNTRVLSVVRHLDANNR